MSLSLLSRQLSGLSALEAHRRKQDVPVPHFFPTKQDFTRLRLKPGRSAHPLWISPEDGRIITEGFSLVAEQHGTAQDVCVLQVFIHKPSAQPQLTSLAVSSFPGPEGAAVQV